MRIAGLAPDSMEAMGSRERFFLERERSTCRSVIQETVCGTVSSPASLQPGRGYPQPRKVPQHLLPSSHNREDAVVPPERDRDPGDV